MSGRTARDHSNSRRDHKHDHFQQQQYNHQQSYQRHHYNSSSSSASRFDERRSIHGKNPPSRHLWVGNLSNHITESILSDEFSRFGGLENIAFIPGRSYSFVNFIREDDAIDALNTLQGFSLAGMPLRIEFAKSDKSAPLRDELHLQHRGDLQPRNRSSAISPRESRKRHASPEAYYPDSPRTNERGTDQPTEILWIGFPSCLKVDESILRKAFSPFGDIDKITAFPGRTYAFVQFRNLASACRAKETLQGKLFGNPRVHISFSRKDHASSAGGRRNMRHNAPSSPQFKSFRGSSDNLRTNRNVREAGNSSIRAPHLPNMEYGDPNVMNINRLESTWTHTSGPYEERDLHDHGPDVGPPQGQLGYCRSPFREVIDRSHDFSPTKFRRQSSFPEYQSNLEDTWIYHGGKKLKIDSFPHEELPEYPLHTVEQHKHVFPGFVPEYSLSNESRPPIPHRGLPEKPSVLNQSLVDKHDIWRSSHGTPQSPPPLASLSLPVERKRTEMELHQPEQKEWNWEGTIAKGGTPVCQARCFPVGKVMDFFLPEFLDCTARTGLDMLAKHYYQAACSWVVFFVAASDADMGYYNEFMYYLGKKERAAVAKLDDRNTLFLVPPSDFSQNVLKIPGKLSISGVVLSLEPSSPGLASLPQDNAMKDRGLVYSHVDRSCKLQIPSGPSHMPVPYPNLEKSGVSSASIQANIKTSAPSLFPSYGQGSRNIPYHIENRHEIQTSHPAPQDATSHAFPVPEGYNNSNSGRGGPEFSRVNNDGGTSYSGISRSSSALPLPLGGLQQEQHTASDVYRPSGFIGNQHEILSRVPQRYNNAPQTTDQFPDMLQSSFTQLQQQPVQAENAQAYSHPALGGTQGIVNMGDAEDDGEADPQKRLEATLQLAATLLQQIQQGKAP